MSRIFNPERFKAAIARIDAANSEDPASESFAGKAYPKGLLYGQRMTAWLDKLAPDASEELQLAVRAQHIRRWAIARGEYPVGRTGYNQWRKTLARFHAETTGEIMREVGYPQAGIKRVQLLLRKERLKLDPEAQTLEDTACLVFLENYLADFSTQHDEEKLVNIVRKTWRKMSPQGHEAALLLILPGNLQTIVEKALV